MEVEYIEEGWEGKIIEEKQMKGTKKERKHGTKKLQFLST